MRPNELNENHLRRLATSMTMVDAAAIRTLDLLDESATPSPLTAIDKSSLPPHEQAVVRELVGRLQALAVRFATRYGLGPQRKDLRRSIHAQMSHVWTILENTRPRKMKGMGRVPDGLAEEIDSQVNDMLALVSSILHATRPTS